MIFYGFCDCSPFILFCNFVAILTLLPLAMGKRKNWFVVSWNFVLLSNVVITFQSSGDFAPTSVVLPAGHWVFVKF